MNFYLYVHGDQPVDEVYILFGHEDPILLHKIRSQTKLWHHSMPLSSDLKNERIEYKYRIFVKGRDSKVPVIGRFWSKDDSVLDETGKRYTEDDVMYDVFQSPHDSRYYIESSPQSYIFYIQWLLQTVNISNISQILQKVEQMHFNRFSAKHVREFIAWIVEQIIGPSVTDTQRLYLCVILGHLSSNREVFFKLPKENSVKKACDRLLECFSANVHPPFISPSSIKILETLASKLVQNSSCPTWLNLVATFYPSLGVHYLLRKTYQFQVKYKYDIKEYHKLMETLLRNIDVTKEEKSAHQLLLHEVLKRAPNNEVVVELFDRQDTDNFFTDEAEKEDFFVKFYQDTHGSTKRSVGEKLVDLLKIPKKLRERLHRLVNSSLLEFVRFDENLREEHSKAFLDLIFSEHNLQIFDLLLEISRSKLVPRQKLLLKILDNSFFRDGWHNLPMKQKVKICSSWVRNKVINETYSDKTTAVYHGIEEIMRCSLNKSNHKLAEEMSETAINGILKNEENLSILKAFINIEKCSNVVRNCYKKHVKEVLFQDRGLMKKSVKVFEEYSGSR